MAQFGEDQFGESQFGTEGADATGTASASTTATGAITGVTVSGSASASTQVTSNITGATTFATASATTTASGQVPFARGIASSISNATGDVTDATAALDLGTQWQIVRDQTEVESDLYDVEVVDTANPFGNRAIAYIDDNSGDKFDNYTRGTRVDFEYSTNDGISYTNRFTGYVVEARELEEQGADALVVECYSFDQFLRRDVVTNDQTGNTITEALEDIVKTDTPVTWNLSNVDVVDDQELTQSFQGERVENALQEIAAKSGNEDFGVNDSTEFFFRPRESGPAPRDIDNTQWFNYDLPEKGKETVNEVTVFFNDGNESITVDNGADRKQLQDNLGTARPVTAATEVNRPDITNIEDARDVAEKILSDRESTLTGTVSTYGLETAKPGDVVDINIIPRGIDGQFRIAEIKYRWGEAQTQITVVEKKGNQDDLLVRLSDTVKRTEMQSADRDATGNVITSTNIGVEVSGSGDVDGTSFDISRITNTARNKLRDAWAGDGNIDITDIAVGDDATQPSRTNTDLGNELERVSVSESLPTTKSVLYEGGFSTTDIREIGLFDSSGDLIARATIPDTNLSATVNIDYTLTVSNDTEFESGVVTDDGQTAVRDCLADNSPNLPSQYAYGTDDTDPTESDTSLGSQATKVSIDTTLVQNADTETEWGNIIDTSQSNVIKITSGGKVTTKQTSYMTEGESYNRGTEGFDGSYKDTTILSDGAAATLSRDSAAGGPDFLEYDFTTAVDIPSGDVSCYVRVDSDYDGTNGNGAPEYTVTLQRESGSSEQIAQTVKGAKITDGKWFEFDASNTLPAGNHTFRFEVTDSDGIANKYAAYIDFVALVNDNWVPDINNMDNSLNSNGGYFDDPPKYPSPVEVDINKASTRRDANEATAEQTWDDTANDQFISISPDGTNYTKNNNTSSATVTFGSATTEIYTRVGISHETTTGQTPLTGNVPQSVDVHEFFADISAITPSGIGVADVRAIVSPGTITGTTIKEAGELDSSDNLLTRAVFADRTIEANQRLISSEKFTWANP